MLSVNIQNDGCTGACLSRPVRWCETHQMMSETIRANRNPQGWGTRHTLAFQTLAAPRRAPLNLQVSVDLGMGIITDFYLKKKRQLHSKKKNYLEYSNNNQNNPDRIMGGFPVMINQSSCLQCVVWSQLTATPLQRKVRKTSPQVRKHTGEWLDSTLVTLVKSAWVLFFFFFFKYLGFSMHPACWAQLSKGICSI